MCHRKTSGCCKRAIRGRLASASKVRLSSVSSVINASAMLDRHVSSAWRRNAPFSSFLVQTDATKQLEERTCACHVACKFWMVFFWRVLEMLIFVISVGFPSVCASGFDLHSLPSGSDKLFRHQTKTRDQKCPQRVGPSSNISHPVSIPTSLSR